MQWLKKLSSPFWRIAGWLIWFLTIIVGCSGGILKFLTKLKQKKEAGSVLSTSLTSSLKSESALPETFSLLDGYDEQTEDIKDETREILEQIDREAEDYRQRIAATSKIPDKRQRLQKLADMVNDDDADGGENE